LLLGGNTATLFEGQVTQFGPTPLVYHQPQDLETARAFSDPPLNTLGATKRGGTISFSIGSSIPATGSFAALADGAYTVGFRAHHLSLDPPASPAVTFPAIVSVSEITGSESYVHLNAGDHRLVALIPGIRRLEPGSAVTGSVDPRHVFTFQEIERLLPAGHARQAA
jgi:glycerol transport system ATP-binding protein